MFKSGHLNSITGGMKHRRSWICADFYYIIDTLREYENMGSVFGPASVLTELGAEVNWQHANKTLSVGEFSYTVSTVP